jgi:hypothetical protein
MYFNDARVVVGTNAINPASLDTLGLMFGRPHILTADVAETLSRQGRFQEVTIPALSTKGATHFGWIRPMEFSGSIACPNGAFAYKFSNREPRYYPVVDKPTFTTEMLEEPLDSKEAWVVIRNASRRPQVEQLLIFDKTKSVEENCKDNSLDIDGAVDDVQVTKESRSVSSLSYEQWTGSHEQGSIVDPWIITIVRNTILSL